MRSFALGPSFCLSQATEDSHLTMTNLTHPSQATEYTGLTISTTADLHEQIMGKYQNCLLVLKGSFLVLFSSVFGSSVLFLFIFIFILVLQVL